MVTRFSLVERKELLNKSQECLWSEEGTLGMHYLTTVRKLKPDTIRKFQLGYIPEESGHQLLKRIIFPIYDASNNLIALSSRSIDSENNFLPSYWHEAYNKMFHLYGIHLAKEWMLKWKFSIIVEGQIDVLQLYNSGFKNVTGLCCSNMSGIQLSLILRYCDQIVLLLDNDLNGTGQKATKKILDTYSNHFGPYGVRIAPVYFNEFIDPDSHICKYGIDGLSKKIKEVVKEFRSDKYFTDSRCISN